MNPTEQSSNDRLNDMVEHAQHALRFLGTMSVDELRNDLKTSFAIVRAIEVIGEAARGVLDEVRAQYPMLPWRQIVGMRHRIAHDYITLDYGIIWQTVTDDLPALVEALEQTK